METRLDVTRKLGKDLIKEAFKERIERQKKQVVKEVDAIMERLAVMQELETKTTKRIKFLQDQLGELDKGNFSVDERTNKIKFDKDELNLDWSETERW